MKYVNMAFGWIWKNIYFFLTALFSAGLFIFWLFPFGDLSQLITTQIYAGSGNQVYVQFETLDMSLLPKPAI